RDGSSLLRKRHVAARGYAPHAVKERALVGDVAEVHEQVNGVPVGRPLELRELKKRLDLAPERDSVSQRRVMHGLDAHRITRENAAIVLEIDEGDGEHSVQASENVVAP